MKKIPLTQGYFATVDDDTFPILTQFKWYAAVFKHTIYARKYNTNKELGSYMHHWILGYPMTGYVTDHIDGDGLNNLRSNLRPITQRQNVTNKKIKTSSVFPGVGWDKHHSIWSTSIHINGKDIKLGEFKSEFLAFSVYREAVIACGSALLPEYEIKYTLLKSLNCT